MNHSSVPPCNTFDRPQALSNIFKWIEGAGEAPKLTQLKMQSSSGPSGCSARKSCAKIFLYYFEIIYCCTFAYHIIVTKHCLWLNIIGPNPNLPPVKIKNLLFYLFIILFMEILQHKLMYKIKNLNHVYDNRNIWFMMHLICMVKWALNLDYSKFSHHLGKHSHRPL